MDKANEIEAIQESQLPEHRGDVESGRELIKATRAFATESKPRSWWLVASTVLLLVGSLVAAAAVPWWPLRAAFSVLGGLLVVRTFITYHDFMHGAILRDSRLAAAIFFVFGCLTLTPPKSWRKSHNEHHGHVGQISAMGVGSFPLITTRMWHASTRLQRLVYRTVRHPLVVLFGYVTIFAFSISLIPLLRDPIRHWDSALALLAHVGLIVTLWLTGGLDLAFFAVILPMTVGGALGAYLFFAQHSFQRMQILAPESWTYYRAALVSSSYLRLGHVMRWFTGNIGYHHVHHLNVRIPFYRLPEAMAAIPALQSPIVTSLSPREIVDCFRASLWDEAHQRMVSYRDA